MSNANFRTSEQSMINGSEAIAHERKFHDLYQPLARLQCRLEIGLMLDSEQEVREVLVGGLKDLNEFLPLLAKFRHELSIGAQDIGTYDQPPSV